MNKTLSILACCILSANVYANARDVHVKIDTFPQAGNPGRYINQMAKYYMTYTNKTNHVETHCYRLELCIDGYKCTKNFDECINVEPNSSRMIGKEMHYARTLDIPGTYTLRAMVKVDSQLYTQLDFFTIYGGF